MKIKQAVKLVAPPILWDTARSVAKRARRLGASGADNGHGMERGSDWYDRALDRGSHFHRHYTESPYYFFWCVLADRLRRAERSSVLDIGCGPGQFATLLRDMGVERYVGLDFSPRRVEAARRACPEFEFVVADAFETDLFETRDYDVLTCMEFLEHVERDLEALRRIPRGVHFLGSVPNFPSESHVRHFTSVDEVRERYASEFEDLTVAALLQNTKGKTFFLIEGIKR